MENTNNENNKSAAIEEKIEKIEALLSEIKEIKDKEIEKVNEEVKELSEIKDKETEEESEESDKFEEIEENSEIEKEKAIKNPWFYFSITTTIIVILLFYKAFLFNPLSNDLSNNVGLINSPENNIPIERFDVSADDDAFLGNKNSPITIIEFSDYQCPFCARFYLNTLPSLKKEYIDTGKVKFVYRDFPLGFHQNAQKAAEATEVARELGGDDAFWKMHDKIFNNQQAISEQDLINYAEEIGLNKAKFKEILASNKYRNEVQKDFKDGEKVGVSGTPAFFINGRNLVGAQPFSEFKKIIDEELKK